MMRPSRMVLWIIVLGAALRIYGLSTESLWLDEATTARRVGMSYTELFSDAGNGTQLPLYFWVSKFWCNMAGTSEFALRFPAALFGIMGILMIYHLGRTLFTQGAGVWGAFFAAINPYLIHYSQEARPYTLLALLAMISWYYMLHLFRDVRVKDLAGYIISTTAVLYTHPLGFLILLTHLAGLLIYRRVPGYRIARRNLKPLLAAVGATLILYLPLLFRLFDQLTMKMGGNSVASWIPVPGIMKLLTTAPMYFMNSWLGVIVLVIATLAAVFRSTSDRKAWPSMLLCISIWICFVAVPWLLSVTITPLFVTRYTIPLLPMILIILGWAIAGFESLPRRIIVTLLLVLTAIPIFDYHTKLDKTPWREGSEYLSGKLRSGDVLIWDPGWNDQLGDYYFKTPGGVENLYVYKETLLESSLSRADRVWLIIPGKGRYETRRLVEADTDHNWQLVTQRIINDSYKRNPHAVHCSELSITLYEKPIAAPVLECPPPSHFTAYYLVLFSLSFDVFFGSVCSRVWSLS